MLTLTFSNTNYDALMECGIPSIIDDLKWAIRMGNDEVSVKVHKLSIEESEKFLKFLKDGGKLYTNQYNIFKVAVDVMKNPHGSKIGRLENLAPALNAIFKDLPNGLIFHSIDGINYPYMVTGAEYITPREDPAYVKISLSYFSKGQNSSASIIYSHSEDRKSTRLNSSH